MVVIYKYDIASGALPDAMSGFEYLSFKEAIYLSNPKNQRGGSHNYQKI